MAPIPSVRRWAFCPILALATATPGVAQDETWSRFRGPNGTGVSTTTGLPAEFGPKKNVVWRRDMLPGHSSPVLFGDLLFLTAFDDNKLFTYCLDRHTGVNRWRREVERKRRTKLDRRNNPASPTPAADKDMVVVFFEEFGMVAYSHAGKQLWQVPLGPFNNSYGMGASPVLFEDRVFLPCDQQTGSYLLCVRKADGKVLWKKPRPHAKSGHCTPVLYWPKKNGDHGKDEKGAEDTKDTKVTTNKDRGTPQLVLPGSFSLDAYDLTNGDRVWWVNGLSFEMKSTPVLHEGILYINGYGSPMNQPGRLVKLSSFEEALEKHDADGNGAISKKEMPRSRARAFFGFVDLDQDGSLNKEDWGFLRAALASKNGMLAITAGGSGDMTAKNTIWSYHRSVPQLPSPLLYGGVLYMLNDQSGLLTTLKPDSGKPIERGRLKDAIDNYYASPVAADGKIYCVSEGGLVTVLKIGGSLKPLATNDLDESCYATPAIAHGRIFLRTVRSLYCFGNVKKKGWR